MAGLIGRSFGGALTAWTPIITPDTGSITAYTINNSLLYRWGKWVVLFLEFTITNNGTGTVEVRSSIPVNSGFFCIMPGRNNSTGRSLQVHTKPSGGSLHIVYASDLAYPCVANERIQISGMYEV